MKREEFLNKLTEKLSPLEEEKRQAIINDYESKIKTRLKNKEKEDDIIASFGDIDLLTKRILKNNIVQDEVTKKEKISYGSFFGEFYNTLLDVLDNISKKDFKTIFIIIGELLLIILIVILLKLPFIVVRELLLNVVGSTGAGYQNAGATTIRTLLDIAYVIFAVLLFMNIFTTRFKKYRKEK